MQGPESDPTIYWKHLISELQEGTKWESIFASIADEISQQTSRWISLMEFQGCSSASSPKCTFLSAMEEFDNFSML